MDEVSFFKPNKLPHGSTEHPAKRDSEDISPTRVESGGNQRRVSERSRNTREETGDSSQHGHGGLATQADDWLTSEVHAAHTEVKLSTFIKASQFKNVRMPSAEEFPFQPRGMYSYKTDNGTPAIPIPRTVVGEASSQRAPRQLLPMGTAIDRLTRILDEGARPGTHECAQATSRDDGLADLQEGPASRLCPSLPCSANDVDEAALAAMSQATILDKGKGSASVMNISDSEVSPSNSHISTFEGKAEPHADTGRQGQMQSCHLRRKLYNSV